MSSSPQVVTDAVKEIGARIDRIPTLTKRHYALVAILTGLFTFDIIDLASFAFVTPAIISEWGVSIAEIGLLTAAGFFGMFLGGMVGGRLADRYGRRPILLIGVTFFSLASLASAFAPDATFLAVTRFLTGVGLQTATGAVLVMASECFPKPFRGRVMSAILCISLIGGPLIAILARILLPLGMWRFIYVVGSLGIIIVLIGLKALPESPRWLAASGRYADADLKVKQFEDEYLRTKGRELPPLFEDSAVPTAEHSAIAEIFSRRLIARTITASVAFILLILLNYGLLQWLPVILVERGYPEADALTFAFVLSCGNIVGAALALLIIDRIERKVLIGISTVIMAVAYLLVGFVNAVPVLLVAGFVAQLLSQTVSATMYTYVPEMFPTEVRGVGAGFANGTGRVAGIFSGIIIAAIIAAYATEGVFVYLAIVAVVMTVVIQFGPSMGIRKARATLKRERAGATSVASSRKTAGLQAQ